MDEGYQLWQKQCDLMRKCVIYEVVISDKLVRCDLWKYIYLEKKVCMFVHH